MAGMPVSPLTDQEIEGFIADAVSYQSDGVTRKYHYREFTQPSVIIPLLRELLEFRRKAKNPVTIFLDGEVRR